MSSNLQQQKQSTRKEEPASPDIQTETQNANQKTVICPNCHAELPEEALFCSECGLSIKQHVCPKCGSPVSPTADICEVCGAWLLQGKCKFCYADLTSDEALFCPECGKPKDGIPCPHCGKLSIFDFCSNCGKPVTEEAIAELKHAQKEMASQASSAAPEAALVTVKKTFSSNQEARRWHNAHRPAAKTAKIEAELAKLETLIKSKPQPEKTEKEAPASVRKPLFSERQMASIRKTGAVVDEITRQRLEAERIAEEAERKRKEAERQRQIKEAQERKEALERQLRGRGWLCNAYGVVHPGGPNECADASKGGHWV